MKILNRIQLLLLPILLALYSCYPKGPDGPTDYNLLISAYEPEYNFESASTFIMPDTLVLLNDSAATELVEITDVQRQEIVNAIRDNLVAYGWTDLTSTNTQADALFLASAVVAKYSDNIWNEWKWYEGLDNVNPISINTRYPWYPESFPYLYDFTKGTILIKMIDAESLGSNVEEAPIVWIGSLNGIITSKEVNTSSVIAAIDKIFELSDYPLNKN